MRKILLPVDGSPSSEGAVKHVIQRLKEGEAAEVHVLYVQAPVHERLTEIAIGSIAGLDQDEAEAAIRVARDLLTEAGVAHQVGVETGDPAETINHYAIAQGCNEIVMGTRGRKPLSNLIMGSVASRVVHLAEVPVTLVK